MATCTGMRDNHVPQKLGVVWSCVMRDKVILAEAGEDESTDQSVISIAQELVKKPPTPGWEFVSKKRKTKNLVGVKFHVHEHTDELQVIVWSFACVYDKTVIQQDEAKSFLEKLVYLTDDYWRELPEWRYGGMLAAQTSFAPILQQRMQQVTYMGRAAMVNEQVDSLKQVMSHNIDTLLEREEHLQNLHQDTSKLEELSRQFKKRTKRVKRFQMWQKAKHGVVIGTAVTAGAAVVIVPPLIALL